MKSLLGRLRITESEKIIDDSARCVAHRNILSQKPMLREAFNEFHDLFHRIDAGYFNSCGRRIELGAGVAPVRDSYPEVLTTDIVHDPGLDIVVDAQSMPFEDGSVGAFYLNNCFHHFSNPKKFLSECERTLEVGGGLILIEPYYGPLASFLFKRLFDNESFDMHNSSWEATITAPMDGANQALSYIVFFRDRTILEASFPTLKIVHHGYCSNYVKYLLSGGLNFRQLLPDWTVPCINSIQCFLVPLNRWLALHHIVTIRKVAI